MSPAKARALIFGAFLSALSTCGFASILVDLTSVSADTNGLCPGDTDGYRWIFTATISAGETDGRFTIYDLPGTVCTVEPQTSASSQFLGVNFGVPPADDVALQNVTVNDLIANVDQARTFRTDVILTTSTLLPLVYAWVDINAAGVTQFNSGTVGGTVVSVVPEPATLALLSVGLAGIAFAQRRNRKRVFA